MKKEKTTFQVRDLKKRLNRALKKKQELNTRIMKAIEYIKEQQDIQSEEAGFYNAFTDYININVDNLLDILKESDKE